MSDTISTAILNEIQLKINVSLMGIANKNSHIKQYCTSLRNDVQLTADEVFKQVTDQKLKLIQKIDEFECEALKSTEKIDPNEFDIKELESFNFEWTSQPNKFKNEQEITEIINMKKKAEEKNLKLESLIFNQGFLKFEPNANQVPESILGTLERVPINSIKSEKQDSILSSTKMKKLIKLCGFSSDHNYQLMYKGSRDGFDGETFHSKCNDKPNTLVIIKSVNENIFGGYTEQSWSGDGFKNDPNSFIFSLVNEENKFTKLKCHQPEKAICCQKDCGPIFGLDLFINNNSNKEATSFSDLGHSFQHSNYKYESNEAKSYLAGSYSFKTLEIEVFSLIDTKANDDECNINDKSILIEGTLDEECNENSNPNVSILSIDLDEIKSSEKIKISIKPEDLQIFQKTTTKQTKLVVTKGAAKRTIQPKKEIIQDKTNHQEITNEKEQEQPTRYSMRLRRGSSFNGAQSTTLTLPNENIEPEAATAASNVKVKRTRSKQKINKKDSAADSDIIWI